MIAAGGVFAVLAAPGVAQANPCAIYGSGYVTVQGSEGCERIGGRVRVEADPAARRIADQRLPDHALGYAPHQPAGPSPAQMRTPRAQQWPGAGDNNPRFR